MTQATTTPPQPARPRGRPAKSAGTALRDQTPVRVYMPADRRAALESMAASDGVSLSALFVGLAEREIRRRK